MSKTRKTRTKTYEANIHGKKVRVSVPPATDWVEVMRDGLRENLSPHAIATIAFAVNAHLARGGTTGQMYEQVDWFQQRLVALLGGQDAYERVCREAGL